MPENNISPGDARFLPSIMFDETEAEILYQVFVLHPWCFIVTMK